MSNTFKIKAKVWKWPGLAGWHFVYVEKETQKKIDKYIIKNKIRKYRNGLMKIKAKVGETSWDTTLFPSKKEKCYMLSIKAKVRKLEGIFDSDTIRLEFHFTKI